MARKKSKTPVLKQESTTLSQEEKFKEDVINAVRQHADLIKGILDDYLVTDGAELEIAQALTNLVIAIKMIKVEEYDPKELKPKEIIEKAKSIYEDDEINSSDLLNFIVEGEIIDYVKERGFAFIKVDSMDQKNKLQKFAETELWPHYNQQQENIII